MRNENFNNFLSLELPICFFAPLQERELISAYPERYCLSLPAKHICRYGSYFCMHHHEHYLWPAIPKPICNGNDK
jgi:hypothetical protein